MCNRAIFTLCFELRLLGRLTVTPFRTVHVNVVVPLEPAVVSVTMIVTDEVLAVDPVFPVIQPVEEFSDRPLGNPEAE
jgi:hypothetical protein